MTVDAHCGTKNRCSGMGKIDRRQKFSTATSGEQREQGSNRKHRDREQQKSYRTVTENEPSCT
jgi:hypothetical protein